MRSFWRRLAFLQAHKPYAFLGIFALLGAFGFWRASHLDLVTDFSALLPPNQPSVVELQRLVARVPGVSSVFVVIEGGAPAAQRAFADGILCPLRAIGSPYVADARSGVQAARRFLLPRAGFFLSESDLRVLEDRLGEQERRAFRSAIGADFGDPPGGPPDDPNLNVATAIEKALSDRTGPLATFPDGYYQANTPSGWTQVVAIQSTITAGDIAGAHAALDRIRAVVDGALQRGQGRLRDTAFRVSYAGDLITGTTEYDQIRADVLDVGVVGLVLILGVVIVFFRSTRVLAELGAVLLAGCALTFGLTEVVLGHLNVATAFLFSIVAGNGINFGIIWQARYLEERRAGRPLSRALDAASRHTCAATLAAACAAATAYAALGIGHFRAFQHFAYIGSSGILLCWLTTYLLLPSVVAVSDRLRRRPRLRSFDRARERLTPFEKPFALLVVKSPRVLLAVLASITLVAGGFGLRHVIRGPLEYDMQRLQADAATTSDLYRVSHLANDVLQSGGSARMVLLTDDPKDTPVLADRLRDVRDRAPAGAKPFHDVIGLADLVPPNQSDRLLRLRKVKAGLSRAHERGGLDEATWTRIEPLLPPDDLTPFTIDDLPKELTTPFTEADGTRGRILYIDQTKGELDSDLHYLLRWADAFRSTTLPDGRVVHGSGRAVIFADLLRASLVDMPRAVWLSLGLTLVSVILLFRNARAIALVAGSLILGLIWMLGAMGLANVKFSFISFIALPVTFGIGVDYAVNIYGRYREAPARGVLVALERVGGAVILCSLTTSLGYIALLRAHNLAVRNLGAVAVLGEISCLCAAVLALPSILLIRERRRLRVPAVHRAGRRGIMAVRAIVTLCAIAALAVALSQCKWASVVALVGTMGYRWPLALLPFLLGMALDAVAWRTILSNMAHSVSTIALLQLRIASEAFRILLPGGAAITELAQPSLLHSRMHIPLPVATASVALKKAFVLVTDAALAVCGFAFAADVLRNLPPDRLGQWASWGARFGLVVAFLAGAGIGTLALVGLARGQVGGKLRDVAGRLPILSLRRWLNARAGAFDEADRSGRLFFAAGVRPSLAAAGLLFAQWLAESLDTFVIARLLGIPVSFGVVIACEVTASLLRSLFVFLPGGIGVQDLAHVLLVRATGGVDPISSGAALVLTKRMKEVFWAVTGLSFLAIRTGRHESRSA